MRVGVEDVAGVADRGFADRRRCRRAPPRSRPSCSRSQLSESKMRKTSMPCCGAALDELAHDVVGIIRVADGVAGAQQHLEQDVRDALRAAASSRSHGSSCRNRIDVSNVAPPHISRLNRSGVRCATASATASRSYVRTRVASSDWCASRIVVSVNSSRFCLRTHSANFSGPAPAACCRVPAAAACRCGVRAATPASAARASDRTCPSRPAGR